VYPKLERNVRIIRWIAVLIAAATAAAYAAPHIYPHVELAPWLYPVVGVDVSNHQGKIDWDRLAASGVRFAYIKATEGENFKDKSFAKNWSEAGRVGIPRGAYHFYSLCRNNDAQAKNFIETVSNDPKALPPVVDVEQIGLCTATLTPADHVEILGQFLAALEKHYGRRPIVYTTQEFDATILEGGLLGEHFWARSLVIPPNFRRDQWVIWQYHNRGRRPGINGNLDLNVFRGTRAEFDRFLASGPQPETMP
jgi:lysozyme